MRARPKNKLGGDSAGSGAGMFPSWWKSSVKMHQNAKRNYFYANVVCCCGVNYPEVSLWVIKPEADLREGGREYEGFMIHIRLTSKNVCLGFCLQLATVCTFRPCY